MKHTRFQIQSYSFFSIAFLSLHDNLAAQIIYNDIDPDISLSESPQGIWIDMDGNGTNDFGFQNYSFTTYSFSIQETHTFQFLLVFRYDEQNAIAGTFNLDSHCFPFALSGEELVNSDLSWQNCQTQFLAAKRFHSGIFTHTGSYEKWYNSMISETIDHYVGIRFADDLCNNHYGLVRCDVKDEGRTLIIKDYAYQSECNTAIIAGNMIGDTTLDIEEITNLKAIVYGFNNEIYFNLNESVNDADIHIYDLAGKLIFIGKIANQFARIRFDKPKGVYIVKLNSLEGNLVKKVFIN